MCQRKYAFRLCIKKSQMYIDSRIHFACAWNFLSSILNKKFFSSLLFSISVLVIAFVKKECSHKIYFKHKILKARLLVTDWTSGIESSSQELGGNVVISYLQKSPRKCISKMKTNKQTNNSINIHWNGEHRVRWCIFCVQPLVWAR